MEQIIIYGAGKIGKQYYDFFKLYHMENLIFAFCDRNYKLIDKIDSIPVYAYGQLRNKELTFIIAVAEDEDIRKRLCEDGKSYYNNLASWIKDCHRDDSERIRMWLTYKKWENIMVETEGILDNLDKEIHGAVQELGLDEAVKVYGGFCSCCMRKTIFVSHHYWLRDHYKCIFCNSIPRQRALMRVLEKEMPEWRKMKIHESSPSGSNFNTFKQQCKDYSYSYWYNSKALGEPLGKNVTNQNLEELLFENESFDIFITQDVLEHVDYPKKALIEINRVLKVGGVHIFTTPIYPFAKTRARIEMKGGFRKSILPEIYHENPICGKGALVTYDWGGIFLRWWMN